MALQIKMYSAVIFFPLFKLLIIKKKKKTIKLYPYKNNNISQSFDGT